MGLGRFFRQNLNPMNLLHGGATGSYNTGLRIAGVAAAAPLAVTAAPAIAQALPSFGSGAGEYGASTYGNAGMMGAGQVGNTASAAGVANAVGSTGGNMSRLGRVGGFFKNHGGTVINALALGENVMENRRRNRLEDRYRALAEAEYARRAPLRDRAQEMLMDESAPDTAATFADPTAPQGRYRRVRVGSTGS